MYELNRRFNKFKKLEENKWLYEVCSKVCSQSFKDLENAFNKFFKQGKNRPNLKTDKSKKSFYVRTDNITFTDKYIKISKKKFIRFRKSKNNKLPKGYFSGNTKNNKLSNGRITFDGLNWYFSVDIHKDIENVKLNDFVLGIDFGMKKYMILSNGKVYNHILNDTRIINEKENIKKLYRKISHKYKVNGNYNKTKEILRLEKIINTKYKRIKNIKNTYLHKITKEIVDLRPKKIVVEKFETLRLYNQFRYKRSKEFSKRLLELNFYTLQKYLKYKCKNIGIEYIEVDKLYSATQRCSRCNNVKTENDKMTINDRVYKCNKCGLEIDRDLNASINLSKYTTT